LILISVLSLEPWIEIYGGDFDFRLSALVLPHPPTRGLFFLFFGPQFLLFLLSSFSFLSLSLFPILSAPPSAVLPPRYPNPFFSSSNKAFFSAFSTLLYYSASFSYAICGRRRRRGFRNKKKAQNNRHRRVRQCMHPCHMPPTPPVCAIHCASTNRGRGPNIYFSFENREEAKS
jgi:hypothetical protein